MVQEHPDDATCNAAAAQCNRLLASQLEQAKLALELAEAATAEAASQEAAAEQNFAVQERAEKEGNYDDARDAAALLNNPSTHT